MVAGGGALAAGDKSIIDELLDEFFNEEEEEALGLTAACNSTTDFSSVPGVDSCSDFLSDSVGTFLTDDCPPTSSMLMSPMNYSSMLAAECRVALLNATFSGDPVYSDGVGGGLDVPNDQLQWVSSIFDEASFTDENIPKTPAVSGIDETSDPTSEAARSEVSRPELDSSGSVKPGSKRLRDDSPISTLDSELGDPSGAATVGVRSEKSKAAKTTMTTLKKRKAARAAAAAAASASDRRRCVHCHTDKTPQWRTGPEGPKTLCNACGMRFKSGRLVPEYRPASSPSFVGSHHSNSHRKVLELQRQKSILEQEQEQRQQLFGTCRHDTIFGLPPAMPPPDALFHSPGSRRQFQSLEE